MRIGSPKQLREKLEHLGFVPVLGKHGVFEKNIEDNKTRYRLLALISNKDTALKVYPEESDPITHRFKQNYDAVSEFITVNF